MSLQRRSKPPYLDQTFGLLVDTKPSTVVFKLPSSFQCSFLQRNVASCISNAARGASQQDHSITLYPRTMVRLKTLVVQKLAKVS